MNRLACGSADVSEGRDSDDESQTSCEALYLEEPCGI